MVQCNVADLVQLIAAHAAVHIQRFAGDEAGLVGDQKQAGMGDVLALQSQLEGTENRIAVARRDYIEAVRVYNTELKTFPGVLWASTVFRGNKPMAEFAAGETAQTPPQVKF